MEILKKYLIKREEGIKKWLKDNELDSLLTKADELLETLPKTEIYAEYSEGIQEALEHCVKNPEIKALDFQWYYAGQEPGEALAYGMSDCKTNGKLSKTDLGPNGLPGIELNMDHGYLVDEDFAGIPVNHAINLLVNHINPIIEGKESDLGQLLGDVEDVLTDYFQIWNYKVGFEVCNSIKDNSTIQQLKDRGPFWITMTRHERWSVGIMTIQP